MLAQVATDGADMGVVSAVGESIGLAGGGGKVASARELSLVATDSGSSFVIIAVVGDISVVASAVVA